MNNDQPLAALDVGSNTIRLLVARIEDGEVRPLLDQSEFVRLGLDVAATGRLRPDRETAAIAAIERLAQVARSAGADRIAAVATSAVRDAGNGEEFVQRVRAATGVEVRIISGQEEASLTYLGATLGLCLVGEAVIVDLGGGSAELIAAGPSGAKWERSLPLGSGRLTEHFIHHNPPRPAEMETLAQHVRDVLHTLPATHAATAIFTGGTATHLAWLAGFDDVVVELGPADFKRVMDLVRTLPVGELVRRWNIRPERAEVLPAGLETLETIASWSGAERMVVTRRGMREGVILEARN